VQRVRLCRLDTLCRGKTSVVVFARRGAAGSTPGLVKDWCAEIMSKVDAPMAKVNAKMRQCGVCAHWMREGYDLPSAKRNSSTGETPCDNFVCHQCYVEAGRNWYVTR
jgi:hypothetical protein